jgi:iron complex transport system substrate-binding protein
MQTRKYRSRSIWHYLLLALSLAGLVVGCHSYAPISLVTRPISQDPVAPACRPVQSLQGQTCVPVNPQRLVTLSTADLANALALGVKPIATINDFDLMTGRFPPYIEAQAAGIPIVGSSGQSSLEALYLLKPDLLLGLLGGEPEASPSLINQIAPTVTDRGYEMNWKEVFQKTATLLGREQAAEVALQQYNQRVQTLKMKLSRRYQGKQISFLALYFDSVLTEAHNSFASSILKDVGLQRPPNQAVVLPYGYTELSLEELDKADGDVLLVASFTEKDRKIIAKLQQNPLWQKLKAVQQSQVYMVSGVTWMWGSDMVGANAVLDDLERLLLE